jgi:hypothetical protein
MTVLQNLILGLFILTIPTNVWATTDVLPPVEIIQEQQAKMQPVRGEQVLADLKLNPRSNPERILLAHYKLAKEEPDIGELAKLSPRVVNAQDIDKSAMAIAEYNRMNNRFNLMDAKDPLIIHTKLDLDEYSSLQNLLVFDELNDKTFFRYPVYGENIAIVPKDIAKFSRLFISKEQADNLFKHAAINGSVMAEFILNPEFADRREPFNYEDIDYWLMLASIVEIRLWAKTGGEDILVWHYRDPNYRPEDKKGLGGLYSKE